MSGDQKFTLQPAAPSDLPLILKFIKELAAYEKLANEVTATEAILRESLFGAKPSAEVVLAFAGEDPAGFAVFFHTFSTFLGQRGLYLEDLFVFPEWRGHGLVRRRLSYLARVAVARGCGRMEWSVI